jgi:hemoglobin
VTETTLYDRVGGTAYFEALVDRFYAGVESDPVLLAVYPDHADFAGARHRLTLFLVQYWGGPTTYNEERGHPRLRMRHAPFAIGSLERDRWLLHMRAAIDESGAPDDARAALHDYMTMAADAMRNREDPHPTG